MNTDFPQVQLEQYIKQRKEFLLLEDETTYNRVTVRIHAKGIVPRDEIKGKDIKTKKQFPVKTDDLLVAEIDAKVGGYGIVPKGLRDAIVSSHYYLYEVDRSKLDIDYLRFWLQTPSPLNQLQEYVKGSVNYAAIRPYHFPKLKIPAPNLGEQRRIASKIISTNKLINESLKLYSIILDRHKTLLQSAFLQSLKLDPTTVSLNEFLIPDKIPVEIEDHKEYSQLTVALHRRGIRLRGTLFGRDIKTKKQYLAKAGHFIYSRIDARNGAFGFVPDDLDGAIVTGDFPCFNINEEMVTPEVISIILASEEFKNDCVSDSKGVTNRRRLKEEQLLSIKTKLPSQQDQQKLTKLVKYLWSSAKLHKQAYFETKAIMPAILDKTFKGELVQNEAELARLESRDHETTKKLIERTQRQKAKKKTAQIKPIKSKDQRHTPYKDDAAIVCLLLDELKKIDRPTNEFFIQKHIFVAKHHLHLPINSNFHRKVAGPWSQELKRKVIFAAQKMNWLCWEHGRLVPGPSFNRGLDYAMLILGEHSSQIIDMVDKLKKFQKNGLERWATVLKVVEDLREIQKPITKANIQREIDNWPDKRLKTIFAEESVEYTIDKMVKYKWIQLHRVKGAKQ